MRIGKTLPPAAAPVTFQAILNGIWGVFKPASTYQRVVDSLLNIFGTKYIVLVSSGKAAIVVSLRALSQLFPERNRVIIPAFNCYSVPSAITKAGLIVQPCDINPETMDFDTISLKNALANTKTILAVCPTHFFGIPSSIESVRNMVDDPEITIIEDAAQAMGSALEKLITSHGDIRIFSLGRGKSYSTGTGGIILTDNDLFYEKINSIVASLPSPDPKEIISNIVQCFAINLFIHPHFFWIPRMFPFLKLGETEFNTAFHVKKFDCFRAGCITNLDKYLHYLNNERISRIFLYTKLLSNIPEITLLVKDSSTPCIRFPILFKNPDAVDFIIEKSNSEGLGISKTYPSSVELIPHLPVYNETACINARRFCHNLITLPCHPYVMKKDILKISNLIKSYISPDK